MHIHVYYILYMNAIGISINRPRTSKKCANLFTGNNTTLS